MYITLAFIYIRYNLNYILILTMLINLRIKRKLIKKKKYQIIKYNNT